MSCSTLGWPRAHCVRVRRSSFAWRRGSVADTSTHLARQKTTVPWEVVVVLDGDIDGSRTVLDSYAECLPLKIVEFVTNSGRSAALNAGFARAKGSVLIRCDDDLVPDAHYVSRHAAHHEGDPVGIVGLYQNVFPPTRYARVYGQPWDTQYRREAYAVPPDMTWRYWAGNCSVTRNTWERIGPTTPTFVPTATRTSTGATGSHWPACLWCWPQNLRLSIESPQPRQPAEPNAPSIRDRRVPGSRGSITWLRIRYAEQHMGPRRQRARRSSRREVGPATGTDHRSSRVGASLADRSKGRRNGHRILGAVWLRVWIRRTRNLMIVSIVIPHYGAPAPTVSLIDQLRRQNVVVDMQVIVVDDCSPEPFPAIDGVEVVRRVANGGFGSAVNSGVVAAHGELLLVLNSDLDVGTDFLDQMVQAAGRFPGRSCRLGLSGTTANSNGPAGRFHESTTRLWSGSLPSHGGGSPTGGIGRWGTIYAHVMVIPTSTG